MSDRESAEYRHTQCAQLILQHVDEGPLPAPGFGRTNELADGYPPHAIEAPGPTKLRERSIDLADESVDCLNEENRPGETGTSPSDGACDGTEVPADQEARCHSIHRDERRTFVTVLMNDLNRTGLVGGPIPREDGPNGTTQQVFAGAA
jgi:hypothetical protein